MAIHCVAAEHGGLIKKRKKKESIRVKRKVSRLTSGGIMSAIGLKRVDSSSILRDAGQGEQRLI